MSEFRTIEVSADAAGRRVDALLAEALPELSRSYIQELISNGRVMCRGKAVKQSLKAACGDQIEIEIPDPVAPEITAQEMKLDILYEDSDVMIVNKPKGLAVHPAPGHEDGTLVNGIMAHCGASLSGINGVLRPGIVHRIDKDTTGALIICKNDCAHRMIAEQLKVHSIHRVYRGIVIGNPKTEEGRIEGNIGRNPKDRKKMAVVKDGGKPAVTHYRVLEQLNGHAYCEFVLETGRTHQIRVHMASIGHPLLGDPLYGPARCRYPLQGQTLHAMTIGFIHPSTGNYVEFQAEIPDYFMQLLTSLKRR